MERKSSSTPSLLDAELGTGGCGSGKIPQTQPGNFLKPLLQGAVMVKKNPRQYWVCQERPVNKRRCHFAST